MTRAKMLHFPSYPAKREKVAAFIPIAATDETVWKIVEGAIGDEEDRMLPSNSTVAVIKDTGREAAVAVVNWYLEAPDEYPGIEERGLLAFITTYCESKVAATLLRAKLDRKEFKL